MKPWDFSPPAVSSLGDTEVFAKSDFLKGKNIALMVTGGIAAMKSPFVARALRQHGANVVAYVTSEALRYVTEDALEWSTNNRVVTKLTADAEHLQHFDAYLVAPATYNVTNKIRFGIADDVVTTTVVAGLGRMERGQSKVLIVPTMHGDMHNHILIESLRYLSDWGVHIVKPRQENGKNNVPDEKSLVMEVCRAVSTSPLKDSLILVTGGHTPVPIDGVRRIVNKFKGRLGIEIAEYLHMLGARVTLIHSDVSYRAPEGMRFIPIKTYDEYHTQVYTELLDPTHRPKVIYDAAIFSAAVADYAPANPAGGKIPSGQDKLTMTLVPTTKVIKEVREKLRDNILRPHMVTFKYEEDARYAELAEIAQQRVKSGYDLVVANSGSITCGGEQVAYLFSDPHNPPVTAVGKHAIAVAIAEHLEGEFIK